MYWQAQSELNLKLVETSSWLGFAETNFTLFPIDPSDHPTNPTGSELNQYIFILIWSRGPINIFLFELKKNEVQVQVDDWIFFKIGISSQPHTGKFQRSMVELLVYVRRFWNMF